MKQIHHFDDHGELRKYKRLSNAFPVDFTIVRLQGDLPGLEWHHGQTINVSEEGFCLETSELTEAVIRFLDQQKVMLETRMFIPPTRPAIKAVTEVIWFKKEGDKYIIGLKFRSIIKSELNRILRHAQWFKISSISVITAAVVLLIGLIVVGVLSYEYRVHVEQLNNNSIPVPKEGR